MGYGQTIKHLLKKQNMTIKELAEKADISVYTLYDITKRDATSIRKETGEKLAEAFGISVDELIDYDVIRLGLKDGNSSLYTRKITLDRILYACERLNNKGLAEVWKFATDLGVSRQYEVEDESESMEEYISKSDFGPEFKV